MILIAHRGIYNGSGDENSPAQIHSALLTGYEAEVDIWLVGEDFYLGHDKPTYRVHSNFVLNTHLWFHCKTVETLAALMNNQCSKVFFHADDEATIAVDTGTSAKWIWTHPNTKTLTSRSVAVLPERSAWTKANLEGCAGICSDWVAEYKRDLGFHPKTEEPAIEQPQGLDIDPVCPQSSSLSSTSTDV